MHNRFLPSSKPDLRSIIWAQSTSGALALCTAAQMSGAVSWCFATGEEVRVRASRPQSFKCERLAGSNGGTVPAGIYIFSNPVPSSPHEHQTKSPYRQIQNFGICLFQLELDFVHHLLPRSHFSLHYNSSASSSFSFCVLFLFISVITGFLKPQCSLAPPMQRGRSVEACSCFSGMCPLHQRRLSSGNSDCVNKAVST